MILGGSCGNRFSISATTESRSAPAKAVSAGWIRITSCVSGRVKNDLMVCSIHSSMRGKVPPLSKSIESQVMLGKRTAIFLDRSIPNSSQISSVDSLRFGK